MRREEFKMERTGLLAIGDVLPVTEGKLPGSFGMRKRAFPSHKLESGPSYPRRSGATPPLAMVEAVATAAS